MALATRAVWLLGIAGICAWKVARAAKKAALACSAWSSRRMLRSLSRASTLKPCWMPWASRAPASITAGGGAIGLTVRAVPSLMVVILVAMSYPLLG